MLRFYDFYPYKSWNLYNVSTQTCARTLALYEAQPVPSTCSVQASCILDNLTAVAAAASSSSSVLLGLTPTILALMGPSLAEIALLSTYRPVLSVLLSIGAPTVFFERMATFIDPLKILVQPPVLRGWKNDMQTWQVITVSITEYLLAIAAVVNILQNAIELGKLSILNWHCMTNFLPLIWAVFPVVIHLITSVTFRFSRVGRAIRNADERPATRDRGWGVMRLITKELNPCFNRRTKIPAALRAREIQPGNLFICVQWFCGFLAIAHVLFGSEVLSSLLFIHPLSAFGVVGRCIVSGLVCRLIVVLELVGLQGRLKIKEDVEDQGDDFTTPQEKFPSSKVTSSDSIP